jgi:hypothetical protein
MIPFQIPILGKENHHLLVLDCHRLYIMSLFLQHTSLYSESSLAMNPSSHMLIKRRVIGIFELWQIYRAKLSYGISSLSLINFNKMSLISQSCYDILINIIFFKLIHVVFSLVDSENILLKSIVMYDERVVTCCFLWRTTVSHLHVLINILIISFKLLEIKHVPFQKKIRYHHFSLVLFISTSFQQMLFY